MTVIPDDQPLFDRVVGYALKGGLPLILFVVSLVAGALALYLTPREEEPQIVVPMVDVVVAAPGLSARQVERQVSTPIEKLLAQIPGVDHVYSTSHSDQALVTLVFHVGEDREDSILNAYIKLYSNQHRIPAGVSAWEVRPVEVDDVPILMLGLWSDNPRLYSDYELRRFAQEVSTELQGIPMTSEVQVVGGRPRLITVEIDPEALAARNTTAGDVVQALQASNLLQRAGDWVFGNSAIMLEAGDVLRRSDELETLVVNVIDGNPVLLREVARINDGPAEADSYSWIGFNAEGSGSQYPMVAISVAKQRGSNAVTVAQDVHARIAELSETLLPPEVHVEVLRDYGETANDKVSNLTGSLALAVITVVVFIWLFLGWRQALIVGLAVPVCYGITLALDMAFGYTINRVTLFALILALGLLVDDPITGVDNISRFMERKNLAPAQRVIGAISEIRVPLIMSTVTIVLAFLPMAWISGMMGPYMAPMAFNVPVSVISSTFVAVLVTPWLASRVMKPMGNDETVSDSHPYVRLMGWVTGSGVRSRAVLWLVLVLFVLTAMMPLLRMVPLKLMPFDNKNELQVLIDMPEGASLEQTSAMARSVASEVARVNEVNAVAAFVGVPSPIDFNGMVRQYYLREAPNLADLRITLADKSVRSQQSHAILLRLREMLAPYNVDDTRVKVVEVPPGPPVLSTLVAEIYADPLHGYDGQRELAKTLMARLRREAHVVEVDSSLTDPRPRMRFVTDKTKAAMSGIGTADIAQTLAMANAGYTAGYLQDADESEPTAIVLRAAPEQRANEQDFLGLTVRGRQGVAKSSGEVGVEPAPQPTVALGELGQFEPGVADYPILHKDLRPVVYVMAELNGRTPAEIIADVAGDSNQPAGDGSDWSSRTYLHNGGGDGWKVPDGLWVNWSGEGEWKITVDVFRDMGLGYLVALIGIMLVLRFQSGSMVLALIIMSAIPLTIIGVMPGFWLLNQFGERVVAGAPDPVLFTATAMIGMIALAGIVVRNSLILVEFIAQSRAAGAGVKDAVIHAGAVRMRPVLLTAGTTLLGNLIITLDPVFSGLALTIIFGIAASTLFTLVVVPIVYLLLFDDQDAAATDNANQEAQA